MSSFNTNKIRDGATCIRDLGMCMSNNLDIIEGCVDRLNDYLSQLASYDKSDASLKYKKYIQKLSSDEEIYKWYKKIWNVVVSGKVSNFDFGVARANVNLLLNSSDELDEIANLLDEYIDAIVKELGEGAVNFVLFDPMRTRSDGLNISLLRNNISADNYKKLLELCGGDDNEVDRLLEACDKYSRENGCGGYSLLYAVNSEKEKNMSKEEFFGNYLMNKLGVSVWYNEMKKKADGESCGPINDVGANKIFDKEGINSRVLEDYDKSTFDGSDEDPLLSCLRNGGKATIMVKRTRDSDYNEDDYMDTFYEFDKNSDVRKQSLSESYDNRKKENYDTSLAKSKHYVTIISINDKNEVSFVDSADLNSSNIRHMKYSDFVQHVVNKKKSGDNYFYDGQGGCVLYGDSVESN